MKIKLVIALFVVAVFASCDNFKDKNEVAKGQTEENLPEIDQAFMSNLISFCGQSFSGRQVFSKEGRESWEGRKFVMHFTLCEEDRVHIPFHVDNDKSRTWMFLAEDGKLRFRHDHRHEDGTPEDQTLYGGYADGKGTDLIQCFPQDEYTEKLLDDEYHRQWNVAFAEDLSTFTYELFLNDELVFALEFDLTEPL